MHSKFHYHLFAVKSDRRVRNCKNLNDLSKKVCVPNKTKDWNLSVFDMIINDSKTLTKHISCECNCKLYGRKFNSDQWWNNDKYWCECWKCHVCKKYYV